MFWTRRTNASTRSDRITPGAAFSFPGVVPDAIDPDRTRGI
ncbi:MAG: hypothetical protein WC342_05285 [Methanoregula sp.]